MWLQLHSLFKNRLMCIQPMSHSLIKVNALRRFSLNIFSNMVQRLFLWMHDLARSLYAARESKLPHHLLHLQDRVDIPKIVIKKISD